MIFLVTDNPEKFRECARVLGRHAVAVERISRRDFDEASLVALFRDHPRAFAVIRETSKLVRASDLSPIINYRDPSLALVEVINMGRLTAWLPDGEGGVRRTEYSREVAGWLDPAGAPDDPAVFDWDGVFRVRGTGFSYHEMRRRGLKNSARDLVLADFAVEHLYLPQRADMVHHPRNPTRTVDFNDPVLAFVESTPALASLPRDRPGLGALLGHVLGDGVFFRAAQNRREKNYWLPGLNAGVPLTAKRDPVHEVTFLFHDLMHFAQPDLVFTGEFGGDRATARNVYVAWRMISEAVSLVLADMLFVEHLAQRGTDYDWTKRRIHPLYRALDVPDDPIEAIRALTRANVRYALLGDDAGFRVMQRKTEAPGTFDAALAAYEEKYEGYFKADYRWTADNFDEMAERADLFARWASLVGARRIHDVGLETLDAFVRSLDPGALRTLEGTVMAVFERVLESLCARAAKPPPPVSQEIATDRAFRRWVLGQSMMFIVWDFLPESIPVARATLSVLDAHAKIDATVIARVRGWMDVHVERLHAAGLISDDDRRTWNGVYPLFEPKYVMYDRKVEGGETLADVARRCFAKPTGASADVTRVIDGVRCLDLARWWECARGAPSSRRLRLLLDAAGVAFHDDAKDMVSAPAAALVAVGGLPITFHDDGMASLGALAPTRELVRAIRDGQRAAMGSAAAMTYLNPKDVPLDALGTRVLASGHASIAHVATVTVLVAGFSTAVENELNGQRDLVHVARLTEARTAAQSDPPVCVLDAREVPLFRAVLDVVRAQVEIEGDSRAAPDRQESRHLAFPAAKATLALVTGSLRALQKLVAAVDDEGREREYRRLLVAIRDVLRGLHPELFG